MWNTDPNQCCFPPQGRIDDNTWIVAVLRGTMKVNVNTNTPFPG